MALTHTVYIHTILIADWLSARKGRANHLSIVMEPIDTMAREGQYFYAHRSCNWADVTSFSMKFTGGRITGIDYEPSV